MRFVEPDAPDVFPDAPDVALGPVVVGVVAEDEGVAGIALAVLEDGPMSMKKMSFSWRTTPGSDRAMKSLVVLEPQRTMMWCQPRRMPSDVRMLRATSLASSSAMPTSTLSAIRWTARRVRARTYMSSSSENRSPVASMLSMSMAVVMS